MSREEFEKKYGKEAIMTTKDFLSYKKVILSEYYELIAKTCYEFIETLRENNLSNAQAKELMGSLANAIKGGHKENLELTNYVASYTMTRIIGEMFREEGDEE